jgi:hypothetical protein
MQLAPDSSFSYNSLGVAGIGCVDECIHWVFPDEFLGSRLRFSPVAGKRQRRSCERQSAAAV